MDGLEKITFMEFFKHSKEQYKQLLLSLKDSIDANFVVGNIEKHGTSFNHLNFMIDTIEDSLDSWDEAKINRWIGYIQGVLVAKGATNLDHERDRVRDNLI